MTKLVAALVCGFIFGWGLLISDMVNPQKVLNFLDLFGQWDPSLILVMGAALIVAGVGYLLEGRRPRPYLAQDRVWSNRTAIDSDLVVGSALFGLGWGLVGLCPGPALTNLATLSPRLLVFVAAMAAGMVLNNLWQRYRAHEARLALAGDG